jgi:hypothetical protein
MDDALLATVNVPNTGSLTAWQTVQADCAPLPDRDHAVLRLEFVGSGYRLNHFNFSSQVAYPEGIPHRVPGTIEFEDFDIGGQHISYFNNVGSNYSESIVHKTFLILWPYTTTRPVMPSMPPLLLCMNGWNTPATLHREFTA